MSGSEIELSVCSLRNWLSECRSALGSAVISILLTLKRANRSVNISVLYSLSTEHVMKLLQVFIAIAFVAVTVALNPDCPSYSQVSFIDSRVVTSLTTRLTTAGDRMHTKVQR